MTGQRRLFLTPDHFSSRIVGTYLTAIVLNPLEFMTLHSGSIQGLETISIQNTVLTEVAFTGYDALINIGKYCTSPTTQNYYILVDSAVITSDLLAKGWISGMQVLYDLASIEYLGSSALYEMQTLYSSGQEVGSTEPTTLEILNEKIDIYSENINPNQNGYYEFILKRSLKVS